MHVINVINLTFDATLVYKIFYKFISSGKDTRNVKNIEVLPISGLMGEAIKRISNSTSVSDLFK